MENQHGPPLMGFYCGRDKVGIGGGGGGHSPWFLGTHYKTLPELWLQGRKEGSVPGGATQSGKGYQLRSNLSGAVAVTGQDCYKKGGCPVIISSQRGSCHSLNC